MLKRHHRVFQAAQLFRDATVAAAAFWLAYSLRFYGGVLDYVSLPDPTESIMVGLGILIFWPTVGWMQGLYGSRRAVGAAREVFEVAKVTVITFSLLVTSTYLFREVRYSRLTIGLWVVLALVLVSLARVLSKQLLRAFRRRGFNLRHVVIVGAGHLAALVERQIQQRPELGLRVLGVVTGHGEKPHANMGPVEVLGASQDIAEILSDLRRHGHNIDQVLVALPIEEMAALDPLMQRLTRETVDVRLIPDVHQYVTLCGSVEDFCGLTMINLQASPLDGWNATLKRFFDLAAGGAAMLVGLPLMALIALLIRISSEGPILFKQVRVGLDGHPFTMYKFRTMRVDSEAQGPGWTVKNDPRRTWIGTILRKLSLDELPQIFNVLRGDMSLVGPRPEQPRFIEEFKEHVPRYALRHKIKAGMTGWAQVNGFRGDTSIEKRIEMDLHYIENWSLGLDLEIIVRTVFGGFISKNAY